jgi:hypothetical protein
MSWGSSKSWKSIPALDRNDPDTCYRLDTISMLRPKFQRLEAWKLFQQGRLKCVCFKLFQQGSFKTSKLIYCFDVWCLLLCLKRLDLRFSKLPKCSACHLVSQFHCSRFFVIPNRQNPSWWAGTDADSLSQEYLVLTKTSLGLCLFRAYLKRLIIMTNVGRCTRL